MRYLTVLWVSVFAAVAATTFLASPPAEAAGSAKKCGGGRISLGADERRIFALHNRERRDRNLKPFCVHPALQKAARAHSKDMIQNDYFSHDTRGRDENQCERVERFGYRFRFCGENIAYGSGPSGKPENIMRMWMNSSGHRRNVLDEKYREIGVGAYTGTYRGTRNVTMYTADFGTRR